MDTSPSVPESGIWSSPGAPEDIGGAARTPELEEGGPLRGAEGWATGSGAFMKSATEGGERTGAGGAAGAITGAGRTGAEAGALMKSAIEGDDRGAALIPEGEDEGAALRPEGDDITGGPTRPSCAGFIGRPAWGRVPGPAVGPPRAPGPAMGARMPGPAIGAPTGPPGAAPTGAVPVDGAPPEVAPCPWIEAGITTWVHCASSSSPGTMVSPQVSLGKTIRRPGTRPGNT